MGAGSLYLFMWMPFCHGQEVAIVAGIICAVACFHYYRPSTICATLNAITIAEDGSVSIGELPSPPPTGTSTGHHRAVDG